MNSVYFPAHVVVLIRRLVNVVSTLSISNQYVSRTQPQPNADEKPRFVNDLKEPGFLSAKEPFNSSRIVEWSWWTLRSNWDRVLFATDKMNAVQEIRKVHKGRAVNPPGMVLKSAVNLPNWLPGTSSLPSLFSSFQPEINIPPPDNDSPPRTPPNRSLDDEPQQDHHQPPSEPFEPPRPERVYPSDLIHQLILNPALYNPLRAPRFPIVLCHGLYGFDSRGPSSFPSMRMHYWSNVLRILRGKVGAEVIVTSVPGTGSIPSRAARLDEQLRLHARGRGVNFLAHSMGGLDCRHLISHIRPREYAPLSLMSISTPHRGSPFMDWCTTNIGIGKLRQQEKEVAEEIKRSSQWDTEIWSDIGDEDLYSLTDSLSPSNGSKSSSNSKSKEKSNMESSFTRSLASLPSTFTTRILSIVDSPAYANLTSHYLNNVFNPATPDDPRVKYWSVAGRLSAKSVNVWHPFWLPKLVLDGAEELERSKLKKTWEAEHRGQPWGDDIPLWADEREWGNDGLVTVQSAKWGEFLGIMEGCDHWEMRGARGIEFGVDLPAIPAIGLGSSPSTPTKSARQTSQGDGWGFGEWTRFVGAWKRSKDDTAKKAGTVHKHHKHSPDEAQLHQETFNPSSSSLSSILSEPSKSETPSEKRERELRADDVIVKSSTDKLSVVFDWLIEHVPGGSSERDKSAKGKEKAKEVNTHADDKELGAAAVIYTVSSGSSSSTNSRGAESAESGTPAPPLLPSEMKRRMDREDKGRKKNELASREDLERFYVALSRKMYDEGL